MPAVTDQITVPPYDREVIEGLISTLGQQATMEVLSTVIGDAPRLLDGLQKALAAYDPAALRFWAHSLKSNARTVGAAILVQQLQELENIGAGGSVCGTALKAARAQANYRDLVTAVRKLIYATERTSQALQARVRGNNL